MTAGLLIIIANGSQYVSWSQKQEVKDSFDEALKMFLPSSHLALCHKNLSHNPFKMSLIHEI